MAKKPVFPPKKGDKSDKGKVVPGTPIPPGKKGFPPKKKK